MRTHPALLADGLIRWFPPPDPDDVEVQAAACRVAHAIAVLAQHFDPKGKW